ncbi:MAG: DNA helicase RecQ, partial [Anaerolineae bacterium]|nr:DNA helicase RecQ [Anaerolineae bacterium]
GTEEANHTPVPERSEAQSKDDINKNRSSSTPPLSLRLRSEAGLHIKEILQEKFSYPEFRALQEEIILNVLKKRDSLAVMPTGSGKSLCYQLPATIFSGLTVVVSPLISLMEDQVLELQEWGIPALYLNSTLTHAEYGQAVGQVQRGEINLLYGAPETLLRPETIALLENSRVEAIVIDEAHCISEWGHDFRPEYRQLNTLRRKLPQATILALTATATRRVRADIKKSLEIADANEFTGSFDRPNLSLSVSDKVAGVVQTRDFLNQHKKEAGIIYCSTRDNVDNLTDQLQNEGFPVLPYHAGMDSATRRAHQRRFRYEDNLIIIATVAFGMGINKSNVRFILHYDLPKNIESYYQQIGRAGRDGLPADCLLLFSYSDVRTIRYFISQNAPELRAGAETRLDALLAFVDALNCRRLPLLDYFGEKYQGENCKACDNCLDEGQTDHARPELATAKENLTAPALLFVKTSLETKQIFGSAHLIDILRGSRAKKVIKFGHEKISTYEQGKEYTKEYWQHISIQFIRLRLLKRTKPHGSLAITERGEEVLNGKEVWAKVDKGFIKSSAPESKKYDKGLFEKLRVLRGELASQKNIPPYVIFQDRTLVEMASYFPHSEADLRQIYGVGGRKATEYAPQFLPVIQAYCEENDIKALSKQKPRARKRLSSKKGRERSEYVWEQFQAGKSIEEIAEGMGFKPGTIFGHLQKSLTDGRKINAEYLKKMSKLSAKDGQRVIDAFEEHNDGFLSTIFNALSEEVSYDEIKLWKMIIEAEREK